MNGKKYIIGIDGGGTKTAFVLADSEMNEVMHLRLGRSNPSAVGTDGTISIIKEGVDTMLSQNGLTKSDLGALFAGIAGMVSGDGYIGVVTDAVKEYLPNANVEIGSDGYNPLYAAFPDSDGVAIICGTGSSCFAKKGDVIHRIGGYGPFDGIGNGYEIGQAAITHTLRVIDGRDERSALSDAVLAKHGEGLIEHLGDFLAAGNAAIAAYAPLVFGCYHTDSYAKEILDSNMRYVAEMADAAGRYYEGEYEVKFTGSIACDPLSFAILTEMCPERCKISRLEAEPVYGALAKAKMLLT